MLPTAQEGQLLMRSFFVQMLLVAGILHPVQARPEFEVATVKRSTPVPPGMPLAINLGTFRNATLTLTNVTLSECLQLAHGLVSDQQIAGPEWMKSREVRFDIVAKTTPD